MPGIMILDAEVSLYTSVNQYWTGFTAWAGATPPPGSAKWCGSEAVRVCDFQLNQQIALCNLRDCESLCRSNPPSPLCGGCLAGRASCIETANATYAGCGICSERSTCRSDLSLYGGSAGYSFCCDENRFPCDGRCVSIACSSREQFSRESCACECSSPYVRAQNGACVCPAITCPPNLPILNEVCDCVPCPPPLSPCNGLCVNLQSDRFNCGVCGNTCAPGEGCCAGTCTPLYSNGRCGSCALSCAGANHACCFDRGFYQCRNLAVDNNNCGACGNTCSQFFNTICVNGKCVCPPNYFSCGIGCCGQGWACTPDKYGSTCTCPIVRACGPNGEKCCPAGNTCCGGETCCPSGRVCCGVSCCAPGEVCCNGLCTRLGTPQHCASCTDSCVLFSNDPSEPPILAACDAQHLCRCPAGWVAVSSSPTGADRECCPASTPFPCADGISCGSAPC